mmetsp:Transcript_33838/g.100803  ORF Transcript_33838/g.100803 Transcript_33838/m.100803 type:complete len:320 (+) Transcript_33838:55-1014(+)
MGKRLSARNASAEPAACGGGDGGDPDDGRHRPLVGRSQRRLRQLLMAVCAMVLVMLASSVFVLDSTLTGRAGRLQAGCDGGGVVAVSVAINYTDFLSLVATATASQLLFWVVVVQDNDPEAQRWCGQSAPANLKCTVVNATDGLDKGSMLAIAQRQVYASHPGHYYAVIDADIILPHNFADRVCLLPRPNATSRVLYSLPRLMYDEAWRFRRHVPRDVTGINYNIGYFQMYSAPLLHPPVRCGKAAYCGETFYRMFEQGFRTLPGTPVCCHLGEDAMNWHGRITTRFQLDSADRCVPWLSDWLVYYFQVAKFSLTGGEH